MRAPSALLALGMTLQAQAQAPQSGTASGQEPGVTELDAVRVVAPRPWLRKPADPFARGETVFEKHWDEPPSLYEIGMRGGLVQMGINYTLEKAAEGIRKLPGWKGQVQGAVARPPPLEAVQMQRAQQLHDTDPDAN